MDINEARAGQRAQVEPYLDEVERTYYAASGFNPIYAATVLLPQAMNRALSTWEWKRADEIETLILWLVDENPLEMAVQA